MKLSSKLKRLGIDKPIKNIYGSLQIEKSNITVIDLPFLKSVSGYVYIHSNNSLTDIQLPALESVGGVYFDISYNDSLTDIQLQNLKSVGGDVFIYTNPNLKIFNGKKYKSNKSIVTALKNQVGKA